MLNCRRTADAEPSENAFRRVDAWRKALPESAWTNLSVRDGEKSPLEVDMVKCRVCARTDRECVGPEEVLLVIRLRDEQGEVKHDYYLSNASAETSLAEFARAAKAEHRIEECLQRGKSETAWPIRGSQLAVLDHHQGLSIDRELS